MAAISWALSLADFTWTYGYGIAFAQTRLGLKSVPFGSEGCSSAPFPFAMSHC